MSLKNHIGYFLAIVVLSQFFVIPLVTVHDIGRIAGYLVALSSGISSWMLVLVSVIYLSYGLTSKTTRIDVLEYLIERCYLCIAGLFLTLSSLATAFLANVSIELALVAGNVLLYLGYFVVLRGLQKIFGGGFSGLILGIVVFILVFVSNIVGNLLALYAYEYLRVPLSTSIWSNIYMDELVNRGLSMGWSIPGTILVVVSRVVLERLQD